MSDSYNLDNQIQKYELSLWTHKDEFLGLLKGQISFDGEAQDIRFKLNINGTKTLSFSIPLYVHSRETGEFISNYLWSFIFNEQKIRLIRNKGEDSEQIYDFVIKNFVETRDGDHKFANVECQDYALYELSKVGFSAFFDEDTLLKNDGTISQATIDFWTKKVLLHSKNFKSEIVDNYSSSILYNRGQLVKDPVTGFVYRSLRNDNKNESLPIEPITANSYWVKEQEQNVYGWTYSPLTLYEKENILGFEYGQIDEYSAISTYKAGEYVKEIGGTNVYKSLKFNNSGNLLTNSEYWEFVQTLGSSSESVWKPVAGDPIEKERIIKIQKSNVYNMFQELAEKFQVWVELVYTYNEAYKVIGRTVRFKEDLLLEDEISFSYGVNNNLVSRTTNSEDIVTKMYVANVEDQFDMSDGYLNIDDAPQNRMMEPFLYGFSYYYNSGQMPASQYFNSLALEGEVRILNVQLRKEQANKFNKQKQIDDLIVAQEFMRAKWQGATETKINLQNQLSTIENKIVSKTQLSFKVYEFEGKYRVNLSTYKGIISSSFANFKKLDKTSFTSSHSFVYDEVDPTKIIGLEYVTNPDPIGERIFFDFQHNPYAYQLKLIAEWTANEQSFESQFDQITIELTERESELTNINNTIDSLVETKGNLLYKFEQNNYSFIKEGNWQDSNYALKKNKVISENEAISLSYVTREEYYFPNQPGNTSTVFNAYSYRIDLNNIDFNSIQVWKKTGDEYTFCYTKHGDYKIEFGNAAGNNSLLIVPVYGTAFYNAGAQPYIYIKYKRLSDNKYVESSSPMGHGNCNIYKREVIFSEQNIIPGSIKIYSRYNASFLKDESKTTLLVDGTDYLLSTTYNESTYELITTATLKATQNTLFLSSYPRVEVETNDSVKFFYNDVYEVLQRSSVPKVSYETNVTDLSSLLGYDNFIPHVGQKAHILDRELFPNASVPYGLYGFISEIEYDLDNPENTHITISNYKTKFEDIFQRIVATTESVTAREGMFETVNAMISPQRVLNFDVLQDSLTQNYLELSTGTNNSVIWNSTGLTLTDVTGDNPVPGQVRLIGNGIFLSRTMSNGFREWTTAVTASGINASAITTGLLNTKNIIIWNEDQQRFLWNGEGLFAYGENESGEMDFNTFVRLNDQGLLFQRLLDAGTVNEYTETPLSLTWSGLNISGQKGAININSTYGLQVFDDQAVPQERVQIGRLFDDGVETNDFGIRIKNFDGVTVFETDSNGDLIITGTITAGAGNLAGWILSSDEIYKGSGSTKIALNSTTPKIYVGTGNYNNTDTAFYVDDQGQFSLKDKLFFDSSNLTISGTVNATAGNFSNIVTIGGMGASGALEVGSGTNKINIVGDTTDASTYISSGNTSALAGNGFYLGADGKIRIASATDSLTFDGSSLSVTGSIYAESGIIGGFTIGETTLTATNFFLDSGDQRITLGSQNSIAIVDANEGLWLGNSLFASAPFSVSLDGAIKAVSGEIAGWTLSETEFYNGTGLAKIALNSGTNPKIYIGSGNWANADTSFYADSMAKFSLGSKLYYDTEDLTISGTLNASVFQTSSNTGDGSTAGVIIDDTSARFFSSSSAVPLTTISTLDGTLSGTNVNLSGTISSTVFQSGVTGWQINEDGNAEFENITARGALKSTVFIYDEVNAQGGTLMVAESGVLLEDVTKADGATDLVFKIKNTYLNQPYLFEVGDTLKIQTYISATQQIILWLKVVIQNSNTGEFSEYTANILSSTPTTSFNIPAGTAIINYGTDGSGYIILKGDDLTYGPYLDIIVNEGSNIHLPTTQEVKTRVGNLSGITDSLFGGQLEGYGLYSQNAYLTGSLVLPNAGITNDNSAVLEKDNIRIWAGANYLNRNDAPLRIYQDGRMIFKDSLGNNVMELNPETGFTLGMNQSILWGNIADPPTIPDSYEVVITGNHIKFGETETVLTATLLQDGVNRTADFGDSSFEWFLDGVSVGNGKTKTFTNTQINSSAQVQCIFTI